MRNEVKCKQCDGLGRVWNTFHGTIECPACQPTAIPEQEAKNVTNKSEGELPFATFAVIDPSPLPINEKFSIWIDEEGDYMIQSQKETGLVTEATTSEDAIYRMRQLLDMAATLKPAPPEVKR